MHPIEDFLATFMTVVTLVVTYSEINSVKFKRRMFVMFEVTFPGKSLQSFCRRQKATLLGTLPLECQFCCSLNLAELSF